MNNTTSMYRVLPDMDIRPDALDTASPFVSESMLYYVRLIVWSGFCQGVCVFGVITNIINIAVFANAGFKDSINISLFALAISDFGSCLTLIFTTLAMNPHFQKIDTGVAWELVQHVVSEWPHVAFAKITTLITAFITFERCLCVAMPLKVKLILTRKRVIAYLVSCYLFVSLLIAPIFYANQLGYTFYPDVNKTLLGLAFPDHKIEAIENVITPVLSVFLSVFAFVFIIISTVVLVLQLRKKSKWKLTSTAGTQRETETGMGSKEQRISTMVATISTLFIVCFLPPTAMQLVMRIDRRFHIDAEYANLTITIVGFNFLLEVINSSINIFIYYRNSSNYKATFDRLFSSIYSST